MAQLFITLAIIIFIFSGSAAFIVLIRYIFPSFDNVLPTGWGRYLTFRYISYAVLIGSILLLLGTR